MESSGKIGNLTTNFLWIPPKGTAFSLGGSGQPINILANEKTETSLTQWIQVEMTEMPAEQMNIAMFWCSLGDIVSIKVGAIIPPTEQVY